MPRRGSTIGNKKGNPMGKARNLANMANAPIFSATRSTSQSLNSGSYTKAQFATEEFDTTSSYDNVTNHRFQPAVAGYYLITGSVYVQGTGMTQVTAAIYKNGAVHRIGQAMPYPSASQLSSVASAVVYLNGSSDYVELFAFSNGTSPSLIANDALNFFQGALLRAA